MPDLPQLSRTALEFILYIAEYDSISREEKTKQLEARDQECVNLGIAQERLRLQQSLYQLSNDFAQVKAALTTGQHSQIKTLARDALTRIDNVLTREAGGFVDASPMRVGESQLSLDMLPPIDAVVRTPSPFKQLLLSESELQDLRRIIGFVLGLHPDSRRAERAHQAATRLNQALENGALSSARKAIPTEEELSLSQQLVSILSQHCGESFNGEPGTSEGAVETLTRIIRQRAELRPDPTAARVYIRRDDVALLLSYSVHPGDSTTPAAEALKRVRMALAQPETPSAASKPASEPHVVGEVLVRISVTQHRGVTGKHGNTVELRKMLPLDTDLDALSLKIHGAAKRYCSAEEPPADSPPLSSSHFVNGRGMVLLVRDDTTSPRFRWRAVHRQFQVDGETSGIAIERLGQMIRRNAGDADLDPVPDPVAPNPEHYWATKAKQLWQILDNIDTLGDSIKPHHAQGFGSENDSWSRYFTAVNSHTNQRHLVLRGDLLWCIDPAPSPFATDDLRGVLARALQPGGVFARPVGNKTEAPEHHAIRLALRFLLELDERVTKLSSDKCDADPRAPDDIQWAEQRGSGVVKDSTIAELWMVVRSFMSRCSEVVTDEESNALVELEKRIARDDG